MKPKNHKSSLIMSLHWITPLCQCLSCTGEPKIWHPTPELVPQCHRKGKNHHFSSAAGCPPAQPSLARRTGQWVSAAHCPQGPRVLPCQAASQPASAALSCSTALFHPGCRTWLHLRTLLSVHFSSLMWLFWTGTLSSNFPNCRDCTPFHHPHNIYIQLVADNPVFTDIHCIHTSNFVQMCFTSIWSLLNSQVSKQGGYQKRNGIYSKSICQHLRVCKK